MPLRTGHVQRELAGVPICNATAAKTEPPSAPEGAKAGGKKDGGDWMKGFAKMFTDPEMKKGMRAQQAFGIRMMDGDLAAELGLTPDEPVGQ